MDRGVAVYMPYIYYHMIYYMELVNPMHDACMVLVPASCRPGLAGIPAWLGAAAGGGAALLLGFHGVLGLYRLPPVLLAAVCLAYPGNY
eukprot:1157568-Pelagomonas_calceolata.AAC.10